MPAPRALQVLIDQHLDDLPRPAQGATLQRWRALAAVAEHDLALARLYESHVDARAILQECSPAEHWPFGPGGVWAEESPQSRVMVQGELRGFVQLFGRKSLCVGAGNVAHPLVTAWSASGTGPLLVLVDLNDATVRLEPPTMHADGMLMTNAACTHDSPVTHDVVFQGACGRVIADDEYFLSRPGFWHSRGGMVALWFGVATAAARLLRDRLVHPPANANQPMPLAALGSLDISLSHSAALLRETADWIDQHPQQDASGHVVRLWGSVERTAREVIHLTGRVLGTRHVKGPSALSRRVRDLSTCARLWDSERALVALGERARDARPAWGL